MINAEGIALLKEFERGRHPQTGKLLPVGVPATTAYDDGGGRWTISWGLTGPDIKRGTVWTSKKCEAEFLKRVNETESAVRAACKVEPNEYQIAAMTCLAFNIGLGWEGKKRQNDRDGFRQSSVLRLHNASKWAEAANAFSMWKKDNGEVKAGLVRRRAAEAALYLHPADGEVQSTQCTPQADDPASNRETLVDTLVAGAQQTSSTALVAVAGIAPLWDKINEYFNPVNALIVFGTIITLGTAYYYFKAYLRRKDGDR